MASTGWTLRIAPKTLAGLCGAADSRPVAGPASFDHLTEILLRLTDDGVEFIVCGGVAVVLQGGERLTIDLDISADLGQANATRLISSMARLGLVPRAPVPAEALSNPDAVRAMHLEKGALVFTFLDPENPYRQVDIFLTQEHAYAVLLPSSEAVQVKGRTIRVLSKEQLIAMKEAVRPPRDKDLWDIAVLQRLIERRPGP